MSFFDLLGEFDAALEWPFDDPLLQDPTPGMSAAPAAAAANAVTPPES